MYSHPNAPLKRRAYAVRHSVSYGVISALQRVKNGIIAGLKRCHCEPGRPSTPASYELTHAKQPIAGAENSWPLQQVEEIKSEIDLSSPLIYLWDC